MFTSFSTALSALNATSTAIDVVGNNLANLNTPGFKTSVVYFRDLVTQSLGAGLGETQVGFGTGRPLTIRQFTQGAIQASTGLLDAAVQGDGFFVLKNAQGTRCTRAPATSRWTTHGNLLTNTGERVQGWTSVDPATGILDTNGADRRHRRAGGRGQAAHRHHQVHAGRQPELFGRGRSTSRSSPTPSRSTTAWAPRTC